MDTGALGRTFSDGEIIVRQGEPGSCMYVIQSGQVEVSLESFGEKVPLAVLREGEFFGEMSVFEPGKNHMATVRALGPVRVLTVDKRTLMRRMQEDPSLAFRIVEVMSQRLREIDQILGLQAVAEHLAHPAVPKPDHRDDNEVP